MNFDNLSGSFGADASQVNNHNSRGNKPKAISRFTDKIKHLSAENWVDIICCTIIAATLIIVFCNWEWFMNALFVSFLFPVIKILAKAIAVVAGVLCVGGVISARFRHHRRWYY